MAEFQSNVVKDGKGGQIKVPIFISQADLDMIEKEFVVKEGDVFVVTYPRSGTTWTEQIVHLLVNKGEQGDQRLTDAVPWLETLPHRPHGLLEFLKTMPQRRLFTSHLPYPLMPRFKDTSAKIIYVARNPKDVAISTYFHNQSKLGYEGTWEEHLQRFMTGDVGFGPYFDHVLPWWQASQNDEHIPFMKYEDMKHDQARRHHLGAPGYIPRCGQAKAFPQGRDWGLEKLFQCRTKPEDGRPVEEKDERQWSTIRFWRWHSLALIMLSTPDRLLVITKPA